MLRIAFSGNYTDALWTNVMWAQTTAFELADGPDVAALALDLHGSFGTHFMPQLSDSNALSQTDVVLYRSSDELPASATGIYGGAVSGAKCPAGAAIVVSWVIASYYRGGKPRTYLAGSSATQLADANTWASSHISGVNSAAAAFLGEVNGMSLGSTGTVTLGCLRRVSGGVPLTPAQFYPYTAAVTHQGVGSIRRRNNYS